MTTGESPGTTPQPPATDKRKATLAAVLLVIPIVVLMAVPHYAKVEPTLLGFPFFFWYQFLWVFICSALTFAAYKLMLSARRRPTPDSTLDARDGER